MADILNSAQPTDNTITVSPPEPPEPPPAPMEEKNTSTKPEPVKTSSFDSLIVPREPVEPKTSDVPDKAKNTGSTVPSGGVPKPRKSKLGIILAITLLLFTTLPLAVYFISQQKGQPGDLRSRAANAGRCQNKSGQPATCDEIACYEFLNQTGCTSAVNKGCCEWIVVATPTQPPPAPTTPPPTYTCTSNGGYCAPSSSECSSDTCGGSYTCSGNNYCCKACPIQPPPTYTCTNTPGQFCSPARCEVDGDNYGTGTCQTGRFCCKPKPTSTPTLPTCPTTDCLIDSNTPGAIHCTMSGYPNGTYCCPPDKPTFQNGQCIANPFVKCCPKYDTAYSINTCTGATQGGCEANPNYCFKWGSPANCPTPTHTPSPTPPPGGNWYCNGGKGVPPPIPIACTNGGTYNGKCIIFHCPNGCGGSTCGESSPGVWWGYAPCSSAALTGTECGQIDTVTDDNKYCSPATGCDVKALRCSGCSGGPTRTPTPTSPAPQCPSIQVYKGTQLITDYSTLVPGDSITIWVGMAATQIRVNGGAFVNLAQKNTQGFWTYNVTIPIGRTNFSIEVQ